MEEGGRTVHLRTEKSPDFHSTPRWLNIKPDNISKEHNLYLASNYKHGDTANQIYYKLSHKREWNTEKYSASAFGLVGYGTQKRYIFPYTTRACVITYNIFRLRY